MSGEFFGMIGYSDDNWLLAPSRQALQEMLNTCEEYAHEHNLIFSTDPNPTKCKTKCIAFLKKQRDISPLILCGNPLPWVEAGKHLGHFFKNRIDGMKHDLKVKRAKFIDKRNDLLQEYFFAHPMTKFKMNEIFNSHFTGSPLWDLFSPEARMLESTWNRNIKLIFGLPYETHRYFMCPVSGSKHLRFILQKRFISFAKKCEASSKRSVRHLFRVAKNDVQSIMGSNIRNILLLLNKEDFCDIDQYDPLSLDYHQVSDSDQWRIGLLTELIEAKHGNLRIELEDQEIDLIITDICTT